VVKLLEKAREARFPDTAALVAELDRVIAGEGVPSFSSMPTLVAARSAPATKPISQRLILVIAAVVVGVAGLVGLALSLLSRR
jgi:hypothetical protein